VYERREEKKLLCGRRPGPKSIQRRREARPVPATSVVRTEDGGTLSLFQRAALLDGLMPLQGVLTGESLST